MKRIQFKDRAEVEAKVKALFPERYLSQVWVYWRSMYDEVNVEIEDEDLSSEQLAHLEDILGDDFLIQVTPNYDQPAILDLYFKCECPSE